MPEKVQSIPGANPQVDEIVRDTVSASKGGTHYGAETFSGAVTMAGALTIQNLASLANLAIDLILKKANPALRLIGTEGSAKDWRMVEDAGVVKIQENTGSEGSPTWTTRFSVDSTGITAGEKDPAVAALASSLATTASDFATSSTSLVDITGLSITLTTGARRCLVIFSGVATNNTTVATVRIGLSIDGGSIGIISEAGASSGSSIRRNLSFAFLTDVLSAGSHTIKAQMAVSGGTGTLLAASVTARISVIELPQTS